MLFSKGLGLRLINSCICFVLRIDKLIGEKKINFCLFVIYLDNFFVFCSKLKLIILKTKSSAIILRQNYKNTKYKRNPI